MRSKLETSLSETLGEVSSAKREVSSAKLYKWNKGSLANHLYILKTVCGQVQIFVVLQSDHIP